ncbi:MAG TPA: hypothetical protein VIU63_10760 [Nitrospira sp.]
MKAGRFQLCSIGLAFALSSPAVAQSFQTYVCTTDGTNETFQLRIGQDEFQQRFGSGDWVTNYCYRAEGQTESNFCGFKGTQFLAASTTVDGEIGTPVFTLDTQTGAYWQAGEMGDDDDRGTCRPA